MSGPWSSGGTARAHLPTRSEPRGRPCPMSLVRPVKVLDSPFRGGRPACLTNARAVADRRGRRSRPRSLQRRPRTAQLLATGTEVPQLAPGLVDRLKDVHRS